MEGLVVFVLSFEDGKLEVCFLRLDIFSVVDKSWKDYMFLIILILNLLLFSIDEILRDR